MAREALGGVGPAWWAQVIGTSPSCPQRACRVRAPAGAVDLTWVQVGLANFLATV